MKTTQPTAIQQYSGRQYKTKELLYGHIPSLGGGNFTTLSDHKEEEVHDQLCFTVRVSRKLIQQKLPDFEQNKLGYLIQLQIFAEADPCVMHSGMVDHTDSPGESVSGTCDFNPQFEFEDDEIPEPPAHTSNICECSWSRFRRETKSLRFSPRSDGLQGWRTAISEPQSRSASPDKMRKRRRVHLLRFYPQQEAGKETRSESYVFLHHGNWRQYMKQYRKYHTVGHAGRVNCEDLEWKNLLRHIKLGETFKELLFNTSASLHPPPNFPAMDHWCKEASQAIPVPCQKVFKQREKRGKRYLFQSFNLASVKKNPNEFSPPKWTFSWRDEGLSQTSVTTEREREGLPAAGGLERESLDVEILGETRRRIKRLSPTEKCTQSVVNFKDHRENHQRKTKGKKVKKLKASPDHQMSKTDFQADLDGVGVSLRTVDKSKLVTVLTGVNSFKEKVQTSEYKVFQPHELGSLRLGDSTDSPLERAKRKSADQFDNKKKSERLRNLSTALTEKETSSRKKSKKRNVCVKLEKGEIQSFSIMSYKHLDGNERMQVTDAENTRRTSCERHTPLPRLVQPLSRHTVIWGNKYGTAEQHELEGRIGSPSAEPV